VRIKRSLLASLIGVATLGAGPIVDTCVGIVSDDMCAMSHAAMRMGPTDAECTNACIAEHGGSYVLVVGANVYKLSDQRAPNAFAGQKVKVVGTLDAATLTITVTSMAKA